MHKKKISLSGMWNVVSDCGDYQLQSRVPGSLFQALEESGFWGEKDVFWRDNNRKCVEIADRNFTWSREFVLSQEFTADYDRISLDADGLDTLTEIRINGNIVGETENMHRRYRFDVTSCLKSGINTIEIRFFNTLKHIREKQEERYIWSSVDNVMDGFNRIRKSSCSFGWDWGPQIPDLGIWRDLFLFGIKEARLNDPEIRQQHSSPGEELNEVTLLCRAENLVDSQEDSQEDLLVTYTISDGSKVVAADSCTTGETAEIRIPDARLWWPNGYGEQNLYQVTTELLVHGKVLDRKEQQIGLRTMELERNPDEWGESFSFKVNGISIFAMGGNIIPQDVYLNRVNETVSRKLLTSCRAANFNCIRVWGGGIYPDEAFYNLCDEFGILVWQDLMFACALYEARNPEFRKEITLEVKDNLQRIAHHPSLALICGNNEMEWAFGSWPQMKWNGENQAEYTLQYEFLLPELAAAVAPDVPFWKASPSSGGFFDDPNDAGRGDVHYWNVWHAGAPFTEFRKHDFRFLSEYGFQSFPSYKTVKSYTDKADRNPYSPVMEDHQRNGDHSGNQKIMNYAAEYFRLGKDLDYICYISQLSQAEAGRYAVEHLRQRRYCCSGSTYWQVNDNWPVASWSSIDYFGRWKALHYAMKRAYAPILLSCRENGTRAEIYVSVEGMEVCTGVIEWALKEMDGAVIRKGTADVFMEPRTSKMAAALDFAEELKGDFVKERYLSVTLINSEYNRIWRDTTWFERYKRIDFVDPKVTWAVNPVLDGWEILIKAEKYAKFVELDLIEGDAIFSDNYFDMDGGEERIITIQRAQCSGNPETELSVRSLFDSCTI